jgi:hypothetical protein
VPPCRGSRDSSGSIRRTRWRWRRPSRIELDRARAALALYDGAVLRARAPALLVALEERYADPDRAEDGLGGLFRGVTDAEAHVGPPGEMRFVASRVRAAATSPSVVRFAASACCKSFCEVARASASDFSRA